MSRISGGRRAAIALGVGLGLSAVWWLASGFGPLRAAEPTKAEPDSAAQADVTATLIRQLGDDRFSVRETATDRLSHLGVEIKPALIAALDDPDPEIRFRVKRVLSAVIEADFQRRLAAFAEDVNDTRHCTLPGWSRFRAEFGGEATARRLFVEMQRAEPDLLQALEANPTDSARAAAQVLEARIRGFQESIQARVAFGGAGNMPGLGSVVAMLFVASDPHVTLPEDVAMQLSNYCFQPLSMQPTGNTGEAAIVRKIVGSWVARDAGANLLPQNIWLALRFNLKEGLLPACAALKQGNQPGHVKQFALVLIGKLGGKEHLPVVEQYFADTEVCGRFNLRNTQSEVQVRDVALVVAIHLQGQDPKEYGFDHLEPNEQVLYALHTVGFRTPEDRDAAFKKWAAWQTAHAQPAAVKKSS